MPRVFDRDDTALRDQAAKLEAWADGRWLVMWMPYSEEFAAWHMADPKACHVVQAPDSDGLKIAMLTADPVLWRQKLPVVTTTYRASRAA